MGKCEWCGRPYTTWVNEKSWGGRRFCSQKCKNEYLASKRGDSTSGGTSSSSSGGESGGGDEPILPSGCAKYFYAILAFLGFVVLLAMIFGEKPEDVNDKDQMMNKWAEHLEKRCDAFAEGISADGVDERGLKGYSWDEWMEFKKNGQGKKEEKPAATKPAKIELPTPGAKDVAQNTTWSDVQFTVDERIVTVTSEYDTREAAWREAISTAVETAVINFVSDSSLLNANRKRLKERLKTVDKTDIKKLDVLKDELSGKVFTVKIRAVFDKKSLPPKFKDIYPTCFKEEAAVSAVAQPAPNTSAVPSRRTSQQSATPVVTQSAPKTSVTPSTKTNPQPVKPVTPKVSSPAPAPAMRTTKPKPTPVKPASGAVNSEQKTAENKPAQLAPIKSQPAENKPTQSVVNNPRPVMPRPVQPQAVQRPVVQRPVVQRPVVQRPVVQSQPVSGGRVWVPGDYVDEVHANGSVVRVWKPGHYETGNTTQPRSPNPAQLKFQQQLDKKIQRKLRKL